MKKFETILFLVFSFIFVFFVISVPGQQRRRDGAEPLKCYQCNSFYDKGCTDFFDNITYPLLPCAPHINKCRKIIQETYHDNHWSVRYIRQCAVEGEIGPEEGRWCKERSGGYNVRLKICQCDNKDGCNSSSKENPSVYLITLTLLICILTFSKFNT